MRDGIFGVPSVGSATAPPPVFFISVASKGLRVYVSDLESTFASIPIRAIIYLTQESVSAILLTMRNAMKKPRTLQQAILHFGNPNNCLAFIVERRWPNGVECPTCGRNDVRFIATRRMWECKGKHARKQFSVKVGTIFEDSALPLSKWLLAIWPVTNGKNGLSSSQLCPAVCGPHK